MVKPTDGETYQEGPVRNGNGINSTTASDSSLTMVTRSMKRKREAQKTAFATNEAIRTDDLRNPKSGKESLKLYRHYSKKLQAHQGVRLVARNCFENASLANREFAAATT